MSTKTQLLGFFQDNRDRYISGAEIAGTLAISRNAVWKAVESLRLDGYGISAVTNRGYRLESCPDILTEAGIVSLLSKTGVFQVDVRECVTSTNTALRELAAQGAPEGYILAAEEQTAGKGRFGRSFYSPAGHGVYFSLLLRPGPKTTGAALITSAAAVAAARAIEEVTGIHTGIKWVNDLFVGNKKVCGILTEASFDMESGFIESAVLGIGINVTSPGNGYPGDIGNIAASLLDNPSCSGENRCRLIASAIDHFWGFYQNLSAREFINEYRSRSIVIGQDILVLSDSENRRARALEIDDNCRLVVRYENGGTAALNSGEISIRQLIINN